MRNKAISENNNFTKIGRDVFSTADFILQFLFVKYKIFVLQYLQYCDTISVYNLLEKAIIK